MRAWGDQVTLALSSHVEMQVSQAKKESLEQQEDSRETLVAVKSTHSAKNVTFAAKSHPHVPVPQPTSCCVAEGVVVREVWARQAQLLIQEVQFVRD